MERDFHFLPLGLASLMSCTPDEFKDGMSLAQRSSKAGGWPKTCHVSLQKWAVPLLLPFLDSPDK